MTMMTSIVTLREPKTLLRRIPHFRDMLWSRQEKVLTARAMATIRPAVWLVFDA